jgi:large subunit ribosomal protein L23
MGIIDRIRKQPADKATKDAAAPKTKKTAKKPEADLSVKAPTTVLPSWMYSVVGAPRVSEKASRLVTETNTYTFNVPIAAEKVAIRKAIEARYGVKVVAVRTIRGAGKVVRRGRIEGRRNAWKKALVELKPGSSIDLSA